MNTPVAARRFIVVYNATPGSYYDTTGRHGLTDTAHPGMGTFISGIKAKSTAAKIAREYNAR